jgi:hypothetical protein
LRLAATPSPAIFRVTYLEPGLCAAPHTNKPNKQHSDSDQRQYDRQDEGGKVHPGGTAAAFAQEALPIECQFKRNHLSGDPKGTHDSGYCQRQTKVENDGSQILNGQRRIFYRRDSHFSDPSRKVALCRPKGSPQDRSPVSTFEQKRWRG